MVSKMGYNLIKLFKPNKDRKWYQPRFITGHKASFFGGVSKKHNKVFYGKHSKERAKYYAITKHWK